MYLVSVQSRLQAVLLCLRYVDTAAASIGDWFVLSWCATRISEAGSNKTERTKKKQKENKKKNVYQGSIRKNNLPIGNYRLRGWEYLATVFSEVGEI